MLAFTIGGLPEWLSILVVLLVVLAIVYLVKRL